MDLDDYDYDAVHYMMCQQVFRLIDYLDDYIGVAMSSSASDVFEMLKSKMQTLGLTVSSFPLIPKWSVLVSLFIILKALFLCLNKS